MQNTAKNSISIAMYQPDIPQNVGAMMRLCACMDTTLHIIEPTAFPWKEKEFRRSGMDYIHLTRTIRHTSWNSFFNEYIPEHNARPVLMTTKGSVLMPSFTFQDNDIIVMGSESTGVPEEVHSAVPHRVRIPMHQDARSLNIVNSAAMAITLACHQTNNFPE